MLFIKPATDTKQAKDYFTRDLSQPDYYLKDAPEMAGQWHGLGAELLGLSGTVDQQRYFALCDNINPATGEQLTPHTKGNRRVLYDFTFDAPKSVSLAYGSRRGRTHPGGVSRSCRRYDVRNGRSDDDARSHEQAPGIPRHGQHGLGGVHSSHHAALGGRRPRSSVALPCGGVQLHLGPGIGTLQGRGVLESGAG